MLTTTLTAIRAQHPREDGWRNLLTHLGKTQADDEPLPFEVILDSNGLNDALWCCRAAPQYDREWRLFTDWCARQVQHLMTDPRSITALDIVERFAQGDATGISLAAAKTAAEAALVAVEADSTTAAQFAADVAGAAAWAATVAAARAAAAAARGDVLATAQAAAAAIGAGAGSAARILIDIAAWNAACDAQAVEFRRIVRRAAR